MGWEGKPGYALDEWQFFLLYLLLHNPLVCVENVWFKDCGDIF